MVVGFEKATLSVLRVRTREIILGVFDLPQHLWITYGIMRKKVQKEKILSWGEINKKAKTLCHGHLPSNQRQNTPQFNIGESTQREEGAKRKRMQQIQG